MAYVKDIIFEQVEEGIEPPFEPVRLEPEAAQMLMDSLWMSGIRPTEGAGTAGSIRAVENHLQDMRAIVFDKLKTPKP